MTFFVYGLFDSGDWSTVKYIGATARLGRPMCHEKESRNARKVLRKHHAIRKIVGAGRHVGWRILEVCDSWKEALTAERQLIQEHAATFGQRPDWNLTDGGEGVLNSPPLSTEARAKISAAGIGNSRHKGWKDTPASRARKRAAKTTAIRESLSVLASLRFTGVPKSVEHRRRQSEALKGRPWSEARRVAQTPEATEKFRMRSTGRIKTAEERALLSAHATARWSDPLFKARTSASMRGSKKRKALARG